MKTRLKQDENQAKSRKTNENQWFCLIFVGFPWLCLVFSLPQPGFQPETRPTLYHDCETVKGLLTADRLSEFHENVAALLTKE